MNIYNLGKTDIILGMPWLVAYNLEINLEIEEVKIMRCPLLCKKIPKKKIIKTRKTRKINVDNKIDLKQIVKEKVKEEKKIEDIVPKRFYKWLKVFRKTKSEKMPTRKPWDHTIHFKPDFVAKKERIYFLSKIEKEEVQAFIED